MVKYLVSTGLLAVAFMTAVAQQALPTPPPPPPPPRSITVTGSAERMVQPDLAIVTLAVQTQAENLGNAVQQNNTIATKATNAVKQSGLPAPIIRTQGFDVQPIYQQPAPGHSMPYPPKITGYQVINRLEVRIPEKNAEQLSLRVSKAIDAALAAGANRVDNVQFTLQDPVSIQRDVLAEATRNAGLTAAAIANAAAVQLGPLLSATAGQNYPQPLMMSATRAGVPEGVASSVPIIAGMLTVQGTVNVVYEIR